MDWSGACSYGPTQKSVEENVFACVTASTFDARLPTTMMYCKVTNLYSKTQPSDMYNIQFVGSSWVIRQVGHAFSQSN
jgi:hypothetical protein